MNTYGQYGTPKVPGIVRKARQRQAQGQAILKKALDNKRLIRRIGTAIWTLTGAVVIGLVGGYALLTSGPQAAQPERSSIYEYAQYMTPDRPDLGIEGNYIVHNTTSGNAYYFPANETIHGKPLDEMLLRKAVRTREERATEARRNGERVPMLTEIIDDVYQRADTDATPPTGVRGRYLSPEEVASALNP